MTPLRARFARLVAALDESRAAPAVAALIGAALGAPLAAVLALAATTSLPAGVELGLTPSGIDAPVATAAEPRHTSTYVTGRDGEPLRELLAEGGVRAQPQPLAAFGEHLPAALLAAEDRRFYEHAGVDPLAVSRAAVDSARAGRITSGASTITQQLARNLIHEPRTARGKLRVVALALRLEADHDKNEILESYLNRIEFGRGLVGAEAAARYYFDKPARQLSLAEAAAIASVPRGPTLYDPRKNPATLVRRRNRVLDRMQSAGLATPDAVVRAKEEPLQLAPRFKGAPAPHFVSALSRGNVDGCRPAEPLPHDLRSARTTLIGDLQREVTERARSTVESLSGRGVTAASVVVLDNATGDILAYVGSPDLDGRFGANDGVLALRQPGSALKPFLYELAFDELDMTPSTLVPDVERAFATTDGSSYRPRNYDGRYHGPVLARDALGNSYNVPAVWLAERVGPARFLDRLRTLGFCSLDQPADHYGLGLALGDGEVRLLDLARAYSTLARGGLDLPVRAILQTVDGEGTVRTMAPSEPTRIVDETTAFLVTDTLRDASSRLASFGADSALDLPFEVAAKTGTSKGFRDNVTAGYTPRITVAVWVGNFDGTPMHGVSGITGAGPLFRSVMLAASRFRPPTPFEAPAQVVARDVCALSGDEPGPSCEHGRRVLMPEGAALHRCTMHQAVEIEIGSGLLAGPGCPERIVERRSFERYSEQYLPWARAAHRSLAPDRFSSKCPGGDEEDTVGKPQVLEPADGARFFIDEGATGRAHLRLRAAASGAARVQFEVTTLPSLGAPRVIPADARGHGVLDLRRGSYTVVVRADDRRSDPVALTVE